MENTKLIDTKIATLAVLALLSGLFMFAQSAPIVATDDVETYLDKAREAVTTDYNIQNAKTAFEHALNVEPKNETALYNLARIYYIVNDYDKSLDTIAQYKQAYPDNKRIHYVAGLANAYAGDLPQAQQEFTDFIASGLSTWAGYLDLAWVLYQQEKFIAAEEVLTTAVGLFGEDNAWLNTSLGGVEIALGNNEAAIDALERAKVAADALTPEQWHANFSFNDPSQSAQEIEQMKGVIAFNLSLARGEDVDEAQVLGVPFADVSPQGATAGAVVSACGDSCPHTTCTPANACGATNTGDFVTCLNTCTVSAPADPSGTCQVSTACGTAFGYNGCSGNCNITSYPVCQSAQNGGGGGGGGVVTYITTDDDGDFDPAEIDAKIFVAPALVNPGATTFVRWLSTETTSCTITGSNGDSWTGIYGEQESSAITQATTYTITCTAFDDSTVTDIVTVNVVPLWQEF